ncbi:MAG: hypothetical protein Q9225_000383 [Loekoesia sp. 1 TL-2023]
MLLDEESEVSDIYVPIDEEGLGYRQQPFASSKTTNQKSALAMNRQQEGGFIADEEDAGGFIPNDDDDDTAGGFIPDEEDQEAGGFLPESNHASTRHESVTVPQADLAQREESLIAETSAGREKEIAEQQLPPPPPRLSQSLENASSSAHSIIKEEKDDKAASRNAETFDEDDLPLHRTITEEELEEATMLQQLYESESRSADAPPPERLPEQIGDDAGNNGKGVISADAEDVAGAASSGNGEKAHEVDDDAEGEKEEEIDAAASEKGSLLSEDPDDEDAEPEWLA